MSVYRASETPTTLPRSLVRRPAAIGAVRWLSRVLILPHVLVGMGLLVAVGVLVANPLLGQDVDARIVSERTSPTKGGYSYQVTYRYTHEGDEFSGHRSFRLGSRPKPSAEERLPPGRIVTVRHIGVGKLRQDELLLPGESAWSSIPPILFFATCWNVFIAIVVRMLWYIPWRNRRLLQWGTPVPGTLTRKYSKAGKGTSYHVDYSYMSASGVRVNDSMTVSSKELWESVQEGQSVTVIHAPDKAKPSLVYECSDHEWAGPSGVQVL